MAFITCPKCNSTVSDGMDNCDMCKSPISPRAIKEAQDKESEKQRKKESRKEKKSSIFALPVDAKGVQTVEKTSKKWKLLQLYAIGIAIIGAILVLIGVYFGPGVHGLISQFAAQCFMVLGFCIVGLTILWCLVIEFFIWWHHK